MQEERQKDMIDIQAGSAPAVTQPAKTEVEVAKSMALEAFRPMTDSIKRLEDCFEWSCNKDGKRGGMFKVINRMVKLALGIESASDPNLTIEQRIALAAIRVKLKNVINDALDHKATKEECKAAYKEAITKGAEFFGFAPRKAVKK